LIALVLYEKNSSAVPVLLQQNCFLVYQFHGKALPLPKDFPVNSFRQ